MVGVFSVLAFLIVPTRLIAQQQFGELLVRIIDQSGARIPEANITVTSPALLRAVEGVTDSTGVFRALALPPGVYKVVATKQGFANTEQTGINVVVGRSWAIELMMTVGAQTRTITVEASTALVDTVKSESATVFGGTLLTETPGARNYLDFVKLIPSVNIDRLTGYIDFRGQRVQGISVDGSSGAENVFYVDGIDTTNMYSGLANQGLRPETIQEFQVKTAGYEAEFGGAMGGVVSVVTRPGGNSFHGQAFYYYSGSALSSCLTAPGNNCRLLRLDPEAAEDVAQYHTYPEDSVNTNEFGFQLGGPILRDKIWFFGHVNPQWNDRRREVTFVSGETGTYSQNGLLRNGDFRLDFQPFQRLRLGTSFTTDNFRWKGGLPTYDGTDNPAFDWARQGFKYPGHTWTNSITATVTPKFVVDVRYGLNGIATRQFLKADEPRWYFLQSNGLIGYPADDALYRPRSYMNYADVDGYATNQDYEKKLTFNTSASWIFNAGGQHSFKFGSQWNRLLVDVNNAYPFDYVRFYWGQIYNTIDGRSLSSTCVGGDGNTYTPCGYYEVRSPFGVIAKLHTDRNAFYFQDSWTIGRRLTINPGLRFEKEEIPSFSDLPEFAGAAFKWGFGDKIAPRFGAAYDVLGNGKMKIFGSWGRFYDAMKLEMANGSFGGFKWISTYYLTDQAAADNWQAIGGPSGAGNYPGTRVESRNWRIPSFEDLDPNLMAMRMTEIVVGSEWEARPGWIFSGRYVRKNLDRAIEDVGRSTPEGEAYYITNPGYGFSVDKFIEAGLPPTPKAKRTYNALEFRLRRPFANRWLGDISYVYSRLRGIYSGLGSSDESGRLSPNVDRDFDSWFLNYDSHGKLIDGPINSDRPHQIKFHGAYEFPFGLRVGGFFNAMSGTPISRTAYLEYIDIMVENRGSDGRNPFFSQTDLSLIQTFHPFKDESKRLEFNVNIVNLFNQETALTTFRYMNREVLPLWSAGDPVENVLGGYDVNAIMAEQGVPLDPRFLKPEVFQPGIGVRFGIRFLF
jgi:hypothetical protein